MTNFLLAGVGGQGIILASDILAEVGAAAGCDAKKSEIHGMSQRGGSVDSHVRWGRKVYSPVAPRGEVDYILAFEIMEGARHIDFLSPGGVVIVNTQKIPPLPVASGAARYPDTEDLMAVYRARAGRVVELDALALARVLGQPAVVSTIMLGALAAFLNLDEPVWLDVIKRRLPPRLLDVNIVAFQAGKRSVGGYLQTDLA